MRILFLSLFFCFFSLSKAQQIEFNFCQAKNPVPIDSLKKCHRLFPSDKKIKIQKFDLVYNSVQGMAMYTMSGDEFDDALMGEILKAKPREMHLTITVLENGMEKKYKDIPIIVKY
jgi:hypothetical protein